MFKIFGSSLIAAGIVLFSSAAFADDCNTDYNGDGVTNEADFEIFKSTVGSAEGDEGYLAQADHNGDGQVSTSDFRIFLACN